MKWNLLGFSFIVSDFSVLPKKYLPQGCKDLFPTSSSRSCRVNFALFCCMAWGKGQVSCFFPFFFLNRAIRGLLGKGDGIWKQQEEGFAWLPGPWCTWSPHLRRAEVSDKVKETSEKGLTIYRCCWIQLVSARYTVKGFEGAGRGAIAPDEGR